MNNQQKGGIVRVVKRDESYAIIDPTFLSDERMSWKAKGLLAYLLSKPSNWRVYVSDLVKRSKDGKDAVYSALRELEACGYLERRQTRQNGRITGFEYTVYERAICSFEPDDNAPVERNERDESDSALSYSENPEVERDEHDESDPSLSYSENPDLGESDSENADHNNIYINNTDLKRLDSKCDTDEKDPILATLAEELRKIPLNDTVNLYDIYFAEIYAMLMRRFPGQVEPDIIRIAAERYVYMAMDTRTWQPKLNVRSPVGLFHDAYSDAIAEWKATRYKRKRA
jgi:DNA-binding MarR family transcriptional regulator